MRSELRVEEIQPGVGKEAVKGALITTQYCGFMENDTKFDSSYDLGKPFQCVIGTGRVIKGWDQGLMGMRVSASSSCRHIWPMATDKWELTSNRIQAPFSKLHYWKY